MAWVCYSVSVYFFPIELVNQLDNSDTVTVSNGQFLVNIRDGLPLVYYPAATYQLAEDEVTDQKIQDNSKQTLGKA